MESGQPLRMLLAQARSAHGQKQNAAAASFLEQALAIDGNCLEAHLLLANIRFPGERYVEVLSRLHGELRPKNYVEIGVASGKTMVLARPDCRRIGIDPAPSLTAGVAPEVAIYRMKSADFFAQHDLAALLDGAPLELAFIDGMHLFENVIEDFASLERYCSRDSTLLIHDCLPLNAVVAARTRQTTFWAGDVWRVLPILRRFRPDLAISAIACAPSGLAVVRRLDPNSDVLVKQREQVMTYGAGLDFSIAEALPMSGIEIVPSDWNLVARLWQ